MKIKIAVGVAVVVLGLAAGIYFLRPHAFHGSVIQSPDPAFNFKLTSSKGAVSLSDYRGKLVVLYFGYTFCPDICPATLANVAQALRDMGDKANDVQVIMISIDPERDTPEKLAEYMQHFSPAFVGVTGSPDKLAEVASLYGIFYEKQKGSEATKYLMDHTATLLVLDREGYLKLVLPFGVTADDIADDLNYMLR
jgi:protein SCO1/2